jgi:RNA polymerase-associated protein CTR9
MFLGDHITHFFLAIDLMVSAIHTLEKLLETPNQKSLEATAMLASLKAQNRSGISSSEAAKDRARAKELFDAVAKAVDSHAMNEDMNGPLPGTGPTPQRWLLEDVDMHAEIAKLWQGDNLARARRALEHGQRLGGNNPDPRITNNLGVIHHFEKDNAAARQMYESALTIANSPSFDPDLAETLSTTILYNLAREYETLEEDNLAKAAYGKLLSRHPEYTDG